MTEQERLQYLADLELYLFLLDYYAKNKDSTTSLDDKAYWAHIDAILDEINLIRRALAGDADEISE